jgi:hypothetical protein
MKRQCGGTPWQARMHTQQKPSENTMAWQVITDTQQQTIQNTMRNKIMASEH